MESTRERFRDDVASPREVAEALRVSEEALKQLRYRKRGPKYVKVGSKIFYRWSDVERYFDKNAVDPSEARP